MSLTSEKKILVSASSALSLAAYLTRKGCPPERIKRECQLDMVKLERPDYRIPIEHFNQLWNLAEEFTHDKAVGLHLGELVKKDEMGVVGHLFFNSKTLREALEQFERLFRLVHEGMQAHFFIEDGLACLNYICEQPDYYNRASMDRTMAISIARAKVFIKKPLKLEVVCFAHPKPAYSAEYNRIFQCPVLFDQTCCGLRFKAEYLDYPLPERNPYLYQVLTGHVNNLLKKLRPHQAISRQVKKLISNMLSHDAVDADIIAERMHMSRQTLYRKLKQEGHVFHQLVDNIRREKAIRYMAAGKYNLSEIAFLLGFSELSAFSRAFKRWTGVSPAQYKDRAAFYQE